MFKNYLTIAFRHLTRHKLFALINLLCLSIGLTFSMIIGVYVWGEKNVNRGIRHVGNQYLLKSQWRAENMGLDITTLEPLAKAAKDEYPGLVANYYRFDPVVNIVTVGDKHIRTQIAAGDTTLVSMYGFRLLHGDPRQAFRNNTSAVVTEDFAQRFFGTMDVLGKVISIQTPGDGLKHDFAISAVLDSVSRNSVTGFTGEPYQVYLPMDANQYFQGDQGDNWSNPAMVAMIELKKGVTPADLEKPFAALLDKYEPPFVRGNLKVQLAPIREYYLKANGGSVEKMLSTLSLVAALILILGVINFVNINIGTSVYRLKEIGLRKVFGGGKPQLVLQHLTESVLLTLTATLLSLFLYQCLRPVFGPLLNTQLPSFWQFEPALGLLLLGLSVVLGLVSGVYPAFVLSASNTVYAVKGKVDGAKEGLSLRKILLIVQFTLAITVFVCALDMSRQVNYLFNRDIGYHKEQVIYISSLPRQWDSLGIVRMKRIKSEVLAVPGVRGVSLSYDIPNGWSVGMTDAYPTNQADSRTSVQLMGADADFAKVYGIRMREGIFLQNGGKHIPGEVVLNETAVKKMGWTYPVVGRTFRIGAPNGTLLTVVGVTRDFMFESLQKPVQPLIVSDVAEPFTQSYRYFSVKLNAPDIARSIAALQDKWKVLFPDAGFEYAFMDEAFQTIYRSELQLQKAAGIATMLNLVIVFMGIFGVLAFTLAKRTKEIAVRKVLGAETGHIVWMFIRDYARLIVVANIIAWPIAWFVMERWLERYAYRVDQNFTPYLSAGLLVLVTSCVLITLQSYVVAVANPVKNLKTE